MSRHNKRVQVSMRGKVIDMDALRTQNDESVAIGNARMNARGDIMGPGGQIEIRREQLIREFYATHPQGAQQVSLKPAVADTFETPAQALARLATQANQTPTPVVGEVGGEQPSTKKTRKLSSSGE